MTIKMANDRQWVLLQTECRRRRRLVVNVCYI